MPDIELIAIANSRPDLLKTKESTCYGIAEAKLVSLADNCPDSSPRSSFRAIYLFFGDLILQDIATVCNCSPGDRQSCWTDSCRQHLLPCAEVPNHNVSAPPCIQPQRLLCYALVQGEDLISYTLSILRPANTCNCTSGGPGDDSEAAQNAALGLETGDKLDRARAEMVRRGR